MSYLVWTLILYKKYLRFSNLAPEMRNLYKMVEAAAQTFLPLWAVCVAAYERADCFFKVCHVPFIREESKEGSFCVTDSARTHPYFISLSFSLVSSLWFFSVFCQGVFLIHATNHLSVKVQSASQTVISSFLWSPTPSISLWNIGLKVSSWMTAIRRYFFESFAEMMCSSKENLAYTQGF